MTPNDGEPVFLPALGIVSCEVLWPSQLGEKKEVSLSCIQVLSLYLSFLIKSGLCQSASHHVTMQIKKAPTMSKQLKHLGSQEGRKQRLCKAVTRKMMLLPGLCGVRWEFSRTYFRGMTSNPKPSCSRWIRASDRRVPKNSGADKWGALKRKISLDFFKSFRNVLSFRDVKSGAELVQNENRWKCSPSSFLIITITIIIVDIYEVLLLPETVENVFYLSP